jgi:glutamyl-Q tRNA(Asp) synthetase
MSYRGRFAPSPTGRLHIGSLTAALASYLDARAHAGEWLLRMEDLDPPREESGAADAILNSLQAHGLYWDQPVLWQSQRHGAYQQALQQLLDRQLAFYCSCSRSELASSAGIHNGICCQQPPTNKADCAVRLLVQPQTISFEDRIQGLFKQQLASEVGDFVLKRKDGMFAYQLAVVVDDAHQQISHCVRGSDLLDSTPRQIYLQQQLGLPALDYSHIPVITNQQQQKLSKQNHAKALLDHQATSNLLQALHYLQQPLPPPQYRQKPDDIVGWATEQWSPQSISKTPAISGDGE